MLSRPKIAILDLKMAILDLKMAMDLSKHIFISSAEKSCTMVQRINHYNISFNTILSLKCQKAQKWSFRAWKWPWICPKIFSSDRQLYYWVLLWSLESSILALVLYGHQTNPSLSLCSYVWYEWQDDNITFCLHSGKFLSRSKYPGQPIGFYLYIT